MDLYYKPSSKKTKNELYVESLYNNILSSIHSLIGDKSTNTQELNMYGKHFLGSSYIGTFPRDKIPTLQDNQACIINLDTSDKNGTHWIALYKKKYIYLYDSFGRRNILPELHYKEALDYDAEQYKKQLDCGQRCLAFLIICKYYGPELILLL